MSVSAEPEPPPSSLPSEQSALTQLEADLKKFEDLYRNAAQLHGQRRGAKALDNTDGEFAFQYLIKPRARPLVVDILTETGLFGAGALAGYGVTLLTQNPPVQGPGSMVVLAALVLGGFSAVFKHISFR
jgi:hypothetical protein